MPLAQVVSERSSFLLRRLKELDADFIEYMSKPAAEIIQELPGAVTYDQAFLAQLNSKIDKLNWLNEGLDSYDTIDDVISSTKESRYNFSPYVIWSFNILNNAALGGPNLLVRFTDTYGRWKQYKLVPGVSLDPKDVKGKLGSVFNVVADTGSAEMIAFMVLRLPYSY